MNALPPTEPTTVRRRSLLGISGVTLLLCLFLPTLRVCGSPTMPISFPPSYAVYLGGLLVGVIGFTTLHRSRRGAFIIVLAMWLATLLAFAAIWIGAVVSDAVGLVLGAMFIVLLALVIMRAVKTAWSERAIASMCLVHALLSLAWSGLLAFDPDGMWGATVSFGAASLMLFASFGYVMREATDARKLAAEPNPLPEARVV